MKHVIIDLEWLIKCLQKRAQECANIDEMHELYSKAESVRLAIEFIKERKGDLQ
jgi:peptidyl-tRNA hydrolase